MNPKERGWGGERATVLFCSETLHPSVPLGTGWKQWPGHGCRQPGLLFLHSNKSSEAATCWVTTVQIQKMGIGGNKLNLPRTLVKAHGVLAVCRARGRTADPSSSCAGRRGAGRLSLK